MSMRALVLVVDDDEDNATVLEAALQGRGFEVTVALSCNEAALLFERGGRPYDAIVTDLSLGDGTAFDLLRRLGTKRPAVAILVTGYGSAEDRRASASAGFQAHLVKPVAIDQLERTLASALASRGTASGAIPLR